MSAAARLTEGDEMNSVMGAISSVARDERCLLAAGRGTVSQVEADAAGPADGPFLPGPAWWKEIIG